MNDGDPLRGAMVELADLAMDVARRLRPPGEEAAELALDTLRSGGRLFFCGTGGSAADAQHLAAEYVVRFRRNREALSALALTTDTSVLTAAGNDLGFESVFSRQIEALGRGGDLLFLHSTSGESENLLRAAEAGRRVGMKTVAFLAKGGGRLAAHVDLAVVIPTDSTARAQEIHLALGHVICEMVEVGLDSMDRPTEGGGVP